MNGLTVSGNQYITYRMKPSAIQTDQALPCLKRFIDKKSKLFLLALLIIATCCFTVIRVNDSPHVSVAAVPQPTSPHSFAQASNYSSQSQMLKKRLPHFIIIGVKKSGTRALLNFLNMHPDIVEAGMEVHFFDRDESFAKGLEWYRQMMPESLPHQLTGEKSPGYYRAPEVPQRIHDMNSSIKLILVVREPVERCMSNYVQHASKNEGLASFEDQVLLSNGEVNAKSPHVFNSNYNLFINNWLALFPLKQLKVVDGNLLVTHPHLVLKDLQEFLNVRQYIDENFFKYDAEKGFYCYYNKSTEPKCLSDTKGRKHPPMSMRVKRKLYEYFQPRNTLFFNKIGRKFDWEIDLSDARVNTTANN